MDAFADDSAPSYLLHDRDQVYPEQFKALWMAENCTATLHNLYTLRGAQVRDGAKWAHHIDEAYLSIRLNSPKAAGRKLVLNVDFTDLKSRYVLTVENAVLNYAHDRQDPKADATISLSKATLNAVQLKETTPEEKIASGDIKITGRREAFGEFIALLDNFPFWFKIVTPRNGDRRAIWCAAEAAGRMVVARRARPRRYVLRPHGVTPWRRCVRHAPAPPPHRARRRRWGSHRDR